MTVLIAIGLNLIIFSLALLWILVPTLYGLPSKPTDPDRIRKALKLAGLQPNETLYDLGAGDGRVLLIAVKEFDSNAVGIEIGPIQCALIWLRIIASGVGNKIKILWKNFYKTDLSDADVLFIYGTSREVIKLAPYLKQQMKPGSRLVSISADFPEWEPSVFDDEGLIFIYDMPPKEGSLTSYMMKYAE